MKRIAAIAQVCLPKKILVDLACDHGYIGIQYIQHHQGKKVYAVDVNANCLQNAIENVRKLELTDRIICVLGDGLQPVPDDAQVVVLAGVGYHLAMEILFGEGVDLSRYEQIVVSVNQKASHFREALYARGVIVTGESLVWEHGKYYEIISFHVRDKMIYPPMPTGTYLLHHDPLYEKYLQQQYRNIADNPYLQEQAKNLKRILERVRDKRD